MRELLNNDSLLAITERMLGKKIGKDNIYKIQQAGTKYVGHVYFDVADDFLYECIAQTTGTTNTTANFKKCGIGENRDKLDNLNTKIRIISGYSFISRQTYDISSVPLSSQIAIFVAKGGSNSVCDTIILPMAFITQSAVSSNYAYKNISNGYNTIQKLILSYDYKSNTIAIDVGDDVVGCAVWYTI